MTQAGNSSEESAINLAAIEKTDKYGCEVLDKCTSSALYKYAQGKWEKCNCDGVFLLYRRSVAPPFAFMVLNKRSTQNHVQYITKAMGLQLQSPFLLYRTESGEIHGMWFYTQRDCLRIADRVGKLVEALGGDSLRVAEDRGAAASKNKAAAAPANKQPAQAHAPTASSAAPAAAQPSAGSGSDAANSILQMLNRAQTDFKHRGLPQQPQPQPKVISVESLFGGSSKQQQQQQPPAVSNGGPPKHRDQYAEMSHQIKEQLGLLGLQQKQQQQQQQQQKPQPSVAADNEEEEEEFLLTPGMLECAASQLLSDYPTQASPSSATGPAAMQSPPQPRDQSDRGRQQPHQQQQAASQVSGDVPALTKEQLRESLLYLLENDEAFLGSLHRAYVASLQRRLTSPRV